MPLAAAAARLYQRGRELGMGRHDDCALIEVLRGGRRGPGERQSRPR